jgi:hypothetical protein
MDEASIASAILGASIARQGIGMDNKPKTGATSLRSILSYEDAGWELPVRELKPLIQELIDSVNELKTEVAALKQSSGTAGGTAHVKIEGDFPFTPSS